jgi:hypothetical protein
MDEPYNSKLDKRRKPRSVEIKEKISAALRGKTLSKEHRIKLSEAKMGVPRSEETRKKISEAHKGLTLSDEGKKKVSKANKGRLLGRRASTETRIKQSLSHKGDKNSFWKGGVTSKNKSIRDGIEYRLWREAVFARDNYTCQECGDRGIFLNAHHIKSFCQYPELRVAINNGITFCKKCHKKKHQELEVTTSCHSLQS